MTTPNSDVLTRLNDVHPPAPVQMTLFEVAR
jgi:hypothetical protein